MRSESASPAASDPHVLACVEDATSGPVVRELVAASGWRNAVIMDGGVATARKYLEGSKAPDLLIVDIDDCEDPVGALYALAGLCPPEMNVIAVGKRSDLTLYRDLLELGVTDYLTKPLTVAGFERALKRERRAGNQPPERRPTQLVTLIGVRGGVGTTTIAAGLAWCLSEQHEKKVAVLDLDLHFGNLALSLDLAPGNGLREALEYPTRIDGRLLDWATLSAGPRLRVLATEEPLIDQPKVAAGAADAIMNVLRNDCDFVIVDMPRHLDDLVRRMVMLASSVGIVTDLSLTAARDTLRLIELSKGLAPGARHMLVANQVGAAHRGEVGRAEFERVIGVPLDHVIPFEASASMTTASAASSLPEAMPNSKATAAMKAIAAQLCGGEAAPKRKSLLPGWLRRSA